MRVAEATRQHSGQTESSRADYIIATSCKKVRGAGRARLPHAQNKIHAANQHQHTAENLLQLTIISFGNKIQRNKNNYRRLLPPEE